MTDISALPPERRRVLVLLDPRNATAAKWDPELSDLQDSREAVLVELPDGRIIDPLLQTLSSRGRLRAGALLVQSPYDPDKYEPADIAMAEFAIAKFMILSQLCQLLGATSVATEHVRVEHHRTTTGSSTSGKSRVYDGHVEAEKELKNKVSSRLRLSDTFAGSAADIVSAETLLSTRGLDGDEELTSLVALRAGDNPLLHREISVSLTRESEDNLQVAAAFSALKLVKIGSTFKRQVEQQLELSVTAKVDFD